MSTRPRARPQPDADPAREAHSRIGNAILDFIGEIPRSEARRSRTPYEAARQRGAEAAAKAALAAGSLALPPGPLGWITLLPELIAVWRIQRQMVADIAALYGQRGSLTREHMLYCLFRHTAAQAFRDLVVRAGQRFIVQRATAATLRTVTGRIGTAIARGGVGKGLSRWLPVAGAIGVGAYAYYDTVRVAATAMELFGAEAVGAADRTAADRS